MVGQLQFIIDWDGLFKSHCHEYSQQRQKLRVYLELFSQVNSNKIQKDKGKWMCFQKNYQYTLYFLYQLTTGGMRTLFLDMFLLCSKILALFDCTKNETVMSSI